MQSTESELQTSRLNRKSGMGSAMLLLAWPSKRDSWQIRHPHHRGSGQCDCQVLWTMSIPWPSKYLPIRDLETEAVGWLWAPTLRADIQTVWH